MFSRSIFVSDKSPFYLYKLGVIMKYYFIYDVLLKNRERKYESSNTLKVELVLFDNALVV